MVKPQRHDTVRDIKETFSRPPNHFRPFAFWFWNADPMKKSVLGGQLRQMKRQGVGGVVPFALHGGETPYAEDPWYDLWDWMARQCKKLGLLCYIYDEHHCPSGTCAGKIVHDFPEYKRTAMMAHTFHVGGGREFHINLQQDLSLLELLKVLVITPEGVVEVDDYTLIHERGTLHFVWKNRASKSATLLITGLKLSSGSLPSTNGTKWARHQQGHVDLLNPAAVRKFLEYTFTGYDERMPDLYGNVIPGVYTDEPGIEYGVRADGGTAFPYTRVMFEEFASRFGYRLENHLAKLVIDCANYQVVRNHYWQLVTDLFADSYMRQYADFCRERGLELTGHLFGEEWLHANTRYNGELHASARHMTIPGIDMLQTHTPYDAKPESGHFSGDVHGARNVVAKLLQSTAHAIGASRISAESCGVPTWGVTLQDLKRMTDWLCAQGINFIVDNGHPISCVGIRRVAGRSTHAPWWPHYHRYADYTARLSLVQSAGKTDAEIAVLHPGTEVFTQMSPGVMAAGNGLRELRRADRPAWETQTEFLTIAKFLDEEHRGFDYLYESALDACSVEKGVILQKAYAYRCLILPPSDAIAEATWKKLQAFLRTGGRVLIVGRAPQRVLGEKQTDKRIPVTTWQSASVLRVSNLTAEKNRRVARAWIEQTAPAQLRVSADAPEKVQCVQRVCPDGSFVFMVNYDTKPNRVTLDSRIEGIYEKWNLETGRVESLTVAEEEGVFKWYHEFQPAEAVLIAARRKAGKRKATPGSKVAVPAQGRKPILLKGPWEFQLGSDNLLLLDPLIAPDMQGHGLEKGWQSPNVNVPWQSLNEGKAGFLLDPAYINCFWLKAEVQCRDLPKRLALIAESETAVRAFVNGRKIREPVERPLWDRQNISFNIRPRMRRGKNVIILRVEPSDYCRITVGRGWHASEPMPLVLEGDFKVSAEGALRKMPLTDTLKTGSWHTQGYPCYAGEATYAQDLRLDSLPRTAKLCLEGARDVVTVRVNGRMAGTRPWSPYAWDVSKLLQPGKNRIEIAVANTLGNISKNTYFGWDGGTYESGFTAAYLQVGE